MGKVEIFMKELRGRLLSQRDLETQPDDTVIQIPGMVEDDDFVTCNRCGTKHHQQDVRLPIGAYYCPTCILLGRVRSDQFLYHKPQADFEAGHTYCRWSGTLTPSQQELSDALVASTAIRLLVHAVTGAGKTEMIYGVISHLLEMGGAVCLASPRIDVCIELHKRISRDFSLTVASLHGGSEDYVLTPLVIATTHQLLRFREAFDLVIVDEVDAFPYVDNAMLYEGVTRALKPGGRTIFLTATSTDALDQQIADNSLTKLSLARRFHGNPLTVPRFKWLGQRFFHHVKQQRLTGFPLLIFYPEIAEGARFAKDLQKRFLGEAIGFVSSKTVNRLELVDKFREGQLTILVATTILERGVTFPRVDVFVYQADHRLYTKSALVQIAGRVGRSADRPEGLLVFFHNGQTRAMKRARREIQAMNRLGGFA
jgi:competence protein ComFA